jgi:hypothetical protein
MVMVKNKNLANMHPRKLKIDPNFKACQLEPGHEYLRNGIFVFNITRMCERIEQHMEAYKLIEIETATYDSGILLSALNQESIEQADLNRPIILAEIAPDRWESGTGVPENDFYIRGYNLMDGHHRLAKAIKNGIPTLQAYVLRMEQHLEFMAEGYEAYVDYWNGKLQEL